VEASGAPDLLAKLLSGNGMLTALLPPSATGAKADSTAEADGAAVSRADAAVADSCRHSQFLHWNSKLDADAAVADSCPVAEDGNFSLVACGWCVQPCGCEHPRLCDVDHCHSEAKQKQLEACKEADRGLALQWPLPPKQREIVALLPVMRRIEVREQVQADKVRQARCLIQLEARAEAKRRFIDLVPKGGGGGHGGGSHGGCLSASLPQGFGATPLRPGALARTVPLPAGGAAATTGRGPAFASTPARANAVGSWAAYGSWSAALAAGTGNKPGRQSR